MIHSSKKSYFLKIPLNSVSHDEFETIFGISQILSELADIYSKILCWSIKKTFYLFRSRNINYTQLNDLVRQSEYFLQIPNLIVECIELDGANECMPIIFEETFANIVSSTSTSSKLESESSKKSGNFITSMKPNAEDYNENKFVNSKSYPNNLSKTAVPAVSTENSNNSNVRSMSSASTTSSSSKDDNGNNNVTNNVTTNGTKASKSKELFLKKSKKSSKDIIASETNTIKLVYYRKTNDEADFFNNPQLVDSGKQSEKNYLVKNELTSSLPINSVNKKSFVFKQLSVENDNHLSSKDDFVDTTSVEDKPNRKSSNESSSTGDDGGFNGNAIADFLVQNNLEIKKEVSVYSLPIMEYNERPIDVEFVEPKIVSDGDLNKCSNIYSDNKSPNVMGPPSDCSFKSKALYESFRGRASTLDRRRLNQGNFQKANSLANIIANENSSDSMGATYKTSTPIKDLKSVAEKDESLKKKELKLIKHVSVNSDSNSLNELVNENLFKWVFCI